MELFSNQWGGYHSWHPSPPWCTLAYQKCWRPLAIKARSGGAASKREKKKKERAERLQKQKGYNLGEQKKIWEIGKIVREQKGEKRKQTEQKQRTRWRDSATPPSSSFSQNQVCSLPFLVPVWWCMLVCKNEKKIIRKPTPETSICNTLFLRFYAL